MKDALIKIIAVSLSAVFLVPFFPRDPVQAQTAGANIVVHLSFEAENFAPPEYLSRVRTLPSPGTTLLLGADLFSQRGNGTLTTLDAGAYLFRWYVRDIKVAETQGQSTFQYQIPTFSFDNPTYIRVDILDPTSQTVLASNAISIPIVAPVALLYRSYNGVVSSLAQDVFTDQPGATIDVVAQPYFFNISNLSNAVFQWAAGGETVQGEGTQPQFLHIHLPSGSSSQNFSIRIENPQNATEDATTNFTAGSQ